LSVRTFTFIAVVMSRLSSQCVGLLVDWLELLCPEIVGSPATSLESQLSLLFGQRRSPDVGRVTIRKSPGNASYLLALLAHQSSWTNVRATLVSLLESRTSVDKYEA